MKRLRTSLVALALLAGLLFSSADARAQAPAFLNQGLVAWYPADGDVLDASGMGHHGINDGVEYVADRFGSPRHAWGFLTKDIVRAVRINDVLIKRGQPAFTTTVWFRLADDTGFAGPLTILSTSPHPALPV